MAAWLRLLEVARCCCRCRRDEPSCEALAADLRSSWQRLEPWQVAVTLLRTRALLGRVPGAHAEVIAADKQPRYEARSKRPLLKAYSDQRRRVRPIFRMLPSRHPSLLGRGRAGALEAPLGTLPDLKC